MSVSRKKSQPNKCCCASQIIGQSISQNMLPKLTISSPTIYVNNIMPIIADKYKLVCLCIIYQMIKT